LLLDRLQRQIALPELGDIIHLGVVLGVVAFFIADQLLE
jgi:hypothetical protein